MKFEFEWSQELIDKVVKTIYEWYDFSIPENELYDILKENIYLAADIYDGKGTDTMTRERLLGKISDKICGMDWPLFGDEEEYHKEHREKFRLAAYAKNYYLGEDFMKDPSPEFLALIEKMKPKEELQKVETQVSNTIEYNNIDL